MRAAFTATALAIIGGSLAANATQTAPADDSSLERESPLVAYALELDHSDSKSQYAATADLRAIDFEMSRHPPPPDKDCAHTLGAARFAKQYAELASIQFSVGDFEAAIRANESALACAPRDASLHASIASANLSLGRISDARTAIEHGNAVDSESPSVRDVRARVDFVQERWADATARFRLWTLPDEETPNLVDYHECFFWLAQRRAGVLHPELPPPPKDESHEKKRWPVQILDLFKGDLTEAELVQVIRDEARGDQPREWLTEALYYVGELRLAEGDVETARKHFASVVNLRVLNFVEFGMARAELARMRERGMVTGKATAEP
jgi:tetratricopeptide (TPR) repeat protein